MIEFDFIKYMDLKVRRDYSHIFINANVLYVHTYDLYFK